MDEGGYEYRAVIWTLKGERRYTCNPKDTHDEALDLGVAIRQNVFGSSDHKVTVERRFVGSWEPVESSVA